MENIRNFSIIAHIDHGKSTLSDRFIQICEGLPKREMKNRVLDSMDLERERGITIKAQSVSLKYKSINGKNFILNLIDTPGHVNFYNEVARSLYACEGVLLIIDSTQGVEAQTLSNCKLAIKMKLKIIPVLNKIDLPTSNVNKSIKEIKEIIGIKTTDCIKCSAKTGEGIIELLEKIITIIPKPDGNKNFKLQALIIDSWFDNYLGVIALIRIKNGTLLKNSKIKIINTGYICKIEKLGIFTPKKILKDSLTCGEIGWIICGTKVISNISVGDTITNLKNPSRNILKKFKKSKPQIYVSLFPVKSNQYKILEDGIKKLSLNDDALYHEIEHSNALGFGFRCGFIGLLHMEIVKERLEREYSINLISTTPTVIYKLYNNKNKILYIDNPSKFPKKQFIRKIKEPISKCTILSPINFVGKIIKLCINKRGKQIEIKYYKNQVSIIYEIPTSEIIFSFFDDLKSVSKGYASLEYEFLKYKKSNMIKLDILINSEKIDALSYIIYNKNIYNFARKILNKIKKTIPRHQFDISLQATIENKVIAKDIIKQLRKNVLSKCYGGDITRKKKLLKKQKDGKKRLKKIGRVNIPQETFFTILKNNK
ncbi:translation elongation factor 4 [Buchnera aphidicola (Ceratoglyphina bambusae)]|uniref:translation elongation factor 4 n=1 Tax=Buchnera aphidicola TaxID=9 RepID=UPI0031B89839